MLFLRISLGISALLLSTSIFLFSLQHAIADDGQDAPYYAPAAAGKLQIAPFRQPIYNKKGKIISEATHFVVWDSENGRSDIYMVKSENGRWVVSKSAMELPDNLMK